MITAEEMCALQEKLQEQELAKRIDETLSQYKENLERNAFLPAECIIPKIPLSLLPSVKETILANMENIGYDARFKKSAYDDYNVLELKWSKKKGD